MSRNLEKGNARVSKRNSARYLNSFARTGLNCWDNMKWPSYVRRFLIEAAYRKQGDLFSSSTRRKFRNGKARNIQASLYNRSLETKTR
jgi:hypothetical protein